MRLDGGANQRNVPAEACFRESSVFCHACIRSARLLPQDYEEYESFGEDADRAVERFFSRRARRVLGRLVTPPSSTATHFPVANWQPTSFHSATNPSTPALRLHPATHHRKPHAPQPHSRPSSSSSRPRRFPFPYLEAAGKECRRCLHEAPTGSLRIETGRSNRVTAWAVSKLNSPSQRARSFRRCPTVCHSDDEFLPPPRMTNGSSPCGTGARA